MVNRRMGIMISLLFLCLLLPCRAQAVSTADAKEFISVEENCSLTVCYGYDGTVFSDLPVNLYKVADVSEDFQYTLTAPFQASALTLNGVSSNSEWNMIRSSLEAYILANRTQPHRNAVTGQTGEVFFDTLVPGLYLAIPENDTENPPYVFFDSALIALPGLDENGFWQYQVAVNSKAEILPPIDSDELIEYKILKLWRGDGNDPHRPEKIEVEIFRNKSSYETVILSEENHWSYSWTVKDDNADWMVVERNIPSGYAATLEKRSTAFILTNTRIPDSPDPEGSPPSKAPKTGDTSNIFFYMTVMYISGTLLILLGIPRKRKYV